MGNVWGNVCCDKVEIWMDDARRGEGGCEHPLQSQGVGACTRPGGANDSPTLATWGMAVHA